jgi:predicted RNA-binding protein
MEIDFNSLKAVFFVKDFIGDKDHKKVRTFNVDLKITPSQRKLIVNFKDGEHLYCTSHSYGRYKVGFFVYPVDPKDNSERIFVINSAVDSVRLMKIEI